MHIIDNLKREFIYLWYYADRQFHQIFFYWLLGMLIGSFISVFAKDKISNTVANTKSEKWGIFGIAFSVILGIISPLCMYGTIPLAATFTKKGVREDYIASFCMASVLLNPQLIIYSMALGVKLVWVRIISCILCGITAGILIYVFYVRRNKKFFDFSKFEVSLSNKDTDKNLFIRYIKNFFRNVKATGLYFIIGIILSALFQRYVPEELVIKIFGQNKAFGVLMAATIGVIYG